LVVEKEDSFVKIAAIYRMQMFKVSEPFIEQQARAFKRYTPLFVGQSFFGTAPSAFESIASHQGLPRWVRAARQIFPADQGIAQRLRRYEPQILHAHFAVDAVYALPIARRLKIPLVTTLHGFDVTRRDASLLASCRPALVNSVLWRRSLQKSGDHFICVSDFIRRAALQKGYDPQKLTVHYIGTDVDLKKPQQLEQAQRKNIIHVARLTEKKGTVFLLRAMSKLRADFKSAHLLIVGEGDLRHALEQEVSALGIAAQVTFVGAKPFAETQELISQASMLILPSITASNGDAEGLGVVTQEAAAYAVPVVVTDSGGIAEAVIDGKTGFVVPEKDIGALAERMARLLRQPEMARHMGLQARAHVEAHFDIKKQSAKLETIYDDVIERKASR
jgi:glycosyltransferase involved in cell wall biosynthesis